MTSTTRRRRSASSCRSSPSLLDEYLERHAPVWPEMLAEIAAAGRRNYSLFLGDGGRLIGYYETDDDDAAQAYLAASPIAARWEAEMARLLRRPRGTARPGRHPAHRSLQPRRPARRRSGEHRGRKHAIVTHSVP